MLALEQRFQVEFLPEEFDQMQSLGQIADLLADEAEMTGTGAFTRL